MKLTTSGGGGGVVVAAVVVIPSPQVIMLGLSAYFPHWRFVTTRLVGFASVPYK